MLHAGGQFQRPHAAVHGHAPLRLLAGRERVNRDLYAVTADLERRGAAFRQRHNRFGIGVPRDMHRRAGNGMVDTARFFHRVRHAHQQILLFFRRRANQRHLAHGFKRIFAHRRFRRTHDCVRAVQHRIGHIADFGTRGHGVFNHAFHHLRGGDAETAHFAGTAYHAFLQRGHGGIAHFHRQIAARHHNAVGCLNNVIQILNGFNAFYFRHQARPDFLTYFVTFRRHGIPGDFHVFRIFHKTHGQIIAADADGRFQIAEIFFGERAGRQSAALFIDAFVAFEHVAVVGHGVDFAAFHFLYGDGEQAVVQQQHVAGADIVRQFAVIQPHTFARAFAFQRGVKQQGFAGMDLDAAARQLGNADFRALQIGHNRHFAPCLPRGFAHDFGIVFMEFGRAVAEIEAHHVQCADGNHVAQQSHIVAAGA